MPWWLTFREKPVSPSPSYKRSPGLHLALERPRGPALFLTMAFQRSGRPPGGPLSRASPPIPSSVCLLVVGLPHSPHHQSPAPSPACPQRHRNNLSKCASEPVTALLQQPAWLPFILQVKFCSTPFPGSVLGRPAASGHLLPGVPRAGLWPLASGASPRGVPRRLMQWRRVEQICCMDDSAHGDTLLPDDGKAGPQQAG